MGKELTVIGSYQKRFGRSERYGSHFEWEVGDRHLARYLVESHIFFL